MLTPTLCYLLCFYYNNRTGELSTGQSGDRLWLEINIEITNFKCKQIAIGI